MRTALLLAPLVLLACRPSSTVENTMPVANLQIYRSLALRVHTSAFAAGGRAMMLEAALAARLREKCSFDQIVSGSEPADMMLDLNITNLGRGGGGFIANPNTATIETLLVLTDRQNGELIGTAKIRGKSSGVLINNSNPENETIDVVAKAIAELLAKSGCSGARVARPVEPVQPPPDTGSGTVGVGSGSGSGEVPPPPDETRRAEAEALNDQGKEKMYAADIAGALALFQQANGVVPDARYQFNICLALGAAERWDEALAACRKVKTMNPSAALAQKADQRIGLLQNRK